MKVKHNFLLKVEDIALKDITKALADAGIKPVSIMEVYKEEVSFDSEKSGEKEKQNT